MKCPFCDTKTDHLCIKNESTGKIKFVWWHVNDIPVKLLPSDIPLETNSDVSN